MLVRVLRQNGGTEVRTRVGAEADLSDTDWRKYPESTTFRVCFNELSRASLARLMSGMSTNSVRAPEQDAEKLSGSATGTVTEIAKRYGLLMA